MLWHKLSNCTYDCWASKNVFEVLNFQFFLCSEVTKTGMVICHMCKWVEKLISDIKVLGNSVQDLNLIFLWNLLLNNLIICRNIALSYGKTNLHWLNVLFILVASEIYCKNNDIQKKVFKNFSPKNLFLIRNLWIFICFTQQTFLFLNLL